MKLLVHREAQAELDAAAEWYERRRHDLGVDLLAESARALGAIAEHPEASPRVPSVHREVRQHLLPRFPILVVYMRRDDALIVLAFAHASRRPGYWASRLRRP